jgi:hypothetical protein
MPDESDYVGSSDYATGQLARALRRLAETGDGGRKVRQWEAVLAGMAAGRITVGSRVPVVDTPAWVTLEVAHGGFATGGYLAETPLSDDERARVAALPDDVPGATDRERLNLWYLGDAGQQELLAALRSGRYVVELPEDAALPIAILLLHDGFPQQGLDLVAELHPFLHRLRFTPRLVPVPRPSGTAVRLITAGEAAATLRAVRVPAQLATMRGTLGVWNPLHDRLITLWCRTVDGELPRLADDGSVAGGWPCLRWPDDWSRERTRWLVDYDRACAHTPPVGRHAHRRGNMVRLRDALLACPADSAALTGRDVGWIRRALADALTRHGEPGSERLAAVRAAQVAIAAVPTYADIAGVVATRIDRYPADIGLPSLDQIGAPVSEQDGSGIAVGTVVPRHLVEKAARALEAPVDELVRRGIIGSGEVLATVLPQLTSRVLSAAIADPVLAGLYEQTYTAFRRRRGLLLLGLEHQVRFGELPWIAALAPMLLERPDTAVAARRTVARASMLAIRAFPQTILPNRLIRELGALTGKAGLWPPLVEEVAADIFMGTFTTKWRAAATVASRVLAGTLYAAYYDLPDEATWTAAERTRRRWGKKTADDFAALCVVRAGRTSAGNSIAGNGMVLEQSQILTTHNLAVLVDALDLTGPLREQAPELAARTFDWVVRRMARPAGNPHAALIQLKNAAYAWRQAIFLLSFCPTEVQRAEVTRLRDSAPPRLAPALDGLAYAVEHGRFPENGPARRFLGWAAGPHWYLDGAAAGDSPGIRPDSSPQP